MVKGWSIDKDIFIALITKKAVVIIVLLVTIANFFPYVGHDYRYFLPRMADIYIHYRLNGFSVQWYTPSFGGGLPAYPNPQHIQFSLPQLLTMLTTPWIASLISIAIFSIIGFISTYYFLRYVLSMHWRVGMLGALFFIGNGFYFQHMAVGHLGYQAFPLFSFILVLLFSDAFSKKVAVWLLAIVGALLVHSAGFYQIVIFVFSLGISFPLLYLIKPSIFDWRRCCIILAGGGGVGVLLSLSKISAILAFMQYFPREISDVYSVGVGRGILGLLLQLLGVMHILPIAWLMGLDAGYVGDLLRYYTGARYGLWELDNSISPVLTIIIIVGVIEYIFIKKKEKFLLFFNKKQWVAVGVFFGALWLCVEFVFAKGIFYPFLRNFPILKSLHVNVRFVSAFIFPLVLIGSVILDSWIEKWSEKKTVFVSDLSSITTIIFLLLYFFVANQQRRSFDASAQPDMHPKMYQEEDLIIKNIGETEGVNRGVSSLKLYEPIFGYSLENFHHQLIAGNVNEVDGGYFNVTNPASLVFPEENKLVLFERISIEDDENFIAFIHHLQPSWQRPHYQHVFDSVSVLIFILVCSGLGHASFQRFKKYL